MERDRGGAALRGGSTDSPADAHHGTSYGFTKAKKKEKGYKSVGLVSSEEDEDDAAMMISGPSSSQRLVFFRLLVIMSLAAGQ